MNKIDPNPVVRVSFAVSGMTINKLLFVIKETTKFNYGYMPIDMIDTDTLSFRLTLCGNGKKRISWNRLSHVQTAIEAFFMGSGNNSKVLWSTSYV